MGVRITEDMQSGRTIPLPCSIAAELRAHRAAQASYRLAIGATYRDLDLVFANRTGAPINGENLAFRTSKPTLAATGLPKRFRWY